jgi:chlorobactene glucosyltransferase
VRGIPLPAGWVGKPHACHRLAEKASGDVLFFLDADVELQPGAIPRVRALLNNYQADAVTAVPGQRTVSFAERLVLPLLHLTYVSWLPLPLVWRSSDPRFLAANGQLLAMRRHAYEASGGFAAVRDAVVDDMAICRALKETGHRVVFADGQRLASCRMYRSAREVWEGFSKNIFEGIGSVPGLAAALALYFAAFLLPWLLAPAALFAPQLAAPALLGIGANVAQRVALTARFRHPPESFILHPLSIVAFIAIALNSWAWHMRGAIRWSGRSYEKREARGG